MVKPIGILSTIFWLVSVPFYVLVLRTIVKNRNNNQVLKTSFFTISVSLGIAQICDVRKCTERMLGKVICRVYDVQMLFPILGYTSRLGPLFPLQTGMLHIQYAWFKNGILWFLSTSSGMNKHERRMFVDWRHWISFQASTFHLLQKFPKNGWFVEEIFMNARFSTGILATFCDQLPWFSQIAHYLGLATLTLNRLTAIVFPLRHDKVSTIVCPCFAIHVTLLSFL